MSTNPNEHWLSLDHRLVVHAARVHREEPLYAEQLIAEATDPMRAALELIDLLVRERVVWADEVTP